MQIVRQDEQLLAAAYGGKLTEFQRLVEQEEVGVNSKNEFGVSALHMAVMSGSLHVAAYMLSRSVNVNAQDDEGQTALHQACIDGDSDAFGLLTAHKADVGARTRVGKTPLHLACWFDHEEIVSFLLEAGADVHAQDNDGKCVLDDEEIDPDIRQLITEHSTVVRKPRVINLEKKTTTTSSMGCCVTEDELVHSEEQGSAAEDDCDEVPCPTISSSDPENVVDGGVTFSTPVGRTLSAGGPREWEGKGVKITAADEGVSASTAVPAWPAPKSTAPSSSKSTAGVTFSSSATTSLSSHPKISSSSGSAIASIGGECGAAAEANKIQAAPALADNPLLRPLDPELDCVRPWEQQSGGAPVSISDAALDRMMAQPVTISDAAPVTVSDAAPVTISDAALDRMFAQMGANMFG